LNIAPGSHLAGHEGDQASNAALDPGPKSPENGNDKHSNSNEPDEHGGVGPSASHGKAGSGAGSIDSKDDGALNAKDVGSMHSVDAHAHEIDSASNTAPGLGSKSSQNGGGEHSVPGNAGEHAPPPMHGADVHNAEPPSIAHSVFGSAALDPLGFGNSFHFRNESAGLGDSGQHLALPGHVPESTSHHDDAAGFHGPLELPSQGHDVLLPASADDLSVPSDHGKSDLVGPVQHDLIV
jgi:hypothetical protein